MNLPRWLMILMLTKSVLAVPVTGRAWWVTWPNRTAHEFAAAMAAENWDEAKAMMTTVPTDGFATVPAWELLDPSQWGPANIEPEPRTMRDFREGRQSFHLAKEWRMTVERGKVKMVGLQVILIDRGWPNMHAIRSSSGQHARKAN
jgi:hypothetical protein